MTDATGAVFVDLDRTLIRSASGPVVQAAMVAEGVNASRAALVLAARYQVEIPITQAVHAIIFEGTSVADSVRGLMERNLRPELVPDDLGLGGG